MATQSEGIQKLLEAEKAAQKEVDAARKGLENTIIIFTLNFYRKGKKAKTGER